MKICVFLLAFFPVFYDAVAIQRVYLTFDDGLLQPGIEHINDVVTEKKSKVSVFLVGSGLAGPRDRSTRTSGFNAYKKNPFIHVCNHSYSHAYDKYRLFYENPSNVYNDILYNQRFLHIKYKVVRLPGRNSWGIGKRRLSDALTKDTSEVLDMLVEKAGFSIIGWDLEWQEIKNILTDPVEVYRAVKQKFKTMKLFTPGHLVILCHDQNFLREDEKDKLKTFIDLLQKDSDISLEFITDYPGVSVVTKT